MNKKLLYSITKSNEYLSRCGCIKDLIYDLDLQMSNDKIIRLYCIKHGIFLLFEIGEVQLQKSKNQSKLPIWF